MKFVEDVCEGLGELACPSLPSLHITIKTNNGTKSTSLITKINSPPTKSQFYTNLSITKPSTHKVFKDDSVNLS